MQAPYLGIHSKQRVANSRTRLRLSGNLWWPLRRRTLWLSLDLLETRKFIGPSLRQASARPQGLTAQPRLHVSSQSWKELWS